MSAINLQVQGMTCGACARRVSHASKSIAGVDAVFIDIQNGLVRIEGDPDTTALLAALNDAGYPAKPIEEQLPAAAPTKTCGSGCGCR